MRISPSPVGEQGLLLQWSISVLPEIRHSSIRYQSSKIPIQGVAASSASLLLPHDTTCLRPVPHRSFPVALVSSLSGHALFISHVLASVYSPIVRYRMHILMDSVQSLFIEPYEIIHSERLGSPVASFHDCASSLPFFSPVMTART
jgi:hypothetical protein